MSQHRTSKYLDEQLQLACDFKNEERYAEAQAVLERLVHEGFDSPELLWFLGAIYRVQKLLPQAIEAFKAAVEAAPYSERASLGLFHSYWASNMEDPAFEEMKRFLAHSECEDYREIIREILERYRAEEAE